MSFSRGAVAAALVAFVSGAGLAQAFELANDRVVDWRSTVEIEHQDRIARFRRLSEERLGSAPAISESRVKARELPASVGTDLPLTRVVFPERVFFETNSSELLPEGRRVIVLVAEVLKRESPDTAVFVAGHTDSRADDAYNYDLSVRRADSVAAALLESGVRQARLWRVGFGEAMPLRENTSSGGMAANRRVEFLLARKAEAVGVWLSRQPVALCRGDPECRRAIAALPRVEALPVTRESVARHNAALAVKRASVGKPGAPRRAALPSIDMRKFVALTPAGRDATAVEQLQPSTVKRSEPARTEVVIERTDPVLLDLREQRLLVGRPER